MRILLAAANAQKGDLEVVTVELLAQLPADRGQVVLAGVEPAPGRPHHSWGTRWSA